MKTMFPRSTVCLTVLGLMIAAGHATAQTLPKKEAPKTPPPPARHIPPAPPEAKSPVTAGGRQPVASAAKKPTAPEAKKPTAPEAKKAAAAGAKPKAGQSGLGLLDQAYSLLASADHDYDGHRIHAMHYIEAAAKVLGGSVSGGGKGGEKQADSDGQLRNAQALLKQAVGSLTGAARGDVSSAIGQLTTALGIK